MHHKDHYKVGVDTNRETKTVLLIHVEVEVVLAHVNDPEHHT